MNCPRCSKEVEIKTPGQYTDVLSCGHVVTKIPTSNIIRHGASPVEAEEIHEKTKQVSELPKIDAEKLLNRALSGISKTYEEFFNSENPVIQDIISEHGQDNAILIFTAIHSHLSKVLFTVNRFRNLYMTRIESLRKEVEDKAVKELIANHDYYYENIIPKKPSKKPKTIGAKINTEIDKAKESLGKLTDARGNPIDVTKVLSNLMWKKDKEKQDYRDGLARIDNDSSKEKEE